MKFTNERAAFSPITLTFETESEWSMFLEMVEFAYMDSQSESKAEKSAIAIKEFTINM